MVVSISIIFVWTVNPKIFVDVTEKKESTFQKIHFQFILPSFTKAFLISITWLKTSLNFETIS